MDGASVQSTSRCQSGSLLPWNGKGDSGTSVAHRFKILQCSYSECGANQLQLNASFNSTTAQSDDHSISNPHFFSLDTLCGFILSSFFSLTTGLTALNNTPRQRLDRTKPAGMPLWATVRSVAIVAIDRSGPL